MLKGASAGTALPGNGASLPAGPLVLEDSRMTQKDLVTPAACQVEMEFSWDILQQLYWNMSLGHCTDCPHSWFEQAVVPGWWQLTIN